MVCAITSAADILVITDREHPVRAAAGAKVVELDAPVRLIESQLAGHLPPDLKSAVVIAEQRLRSREFEVQKQLACKYQDVIDAWSLGITRIPAVVIDRRYVVYGERDVNRAASLIERYRSRQR